MTIPSEIFKTDKMSILLGETLTITTSKLTREDEFHKSGMGKLFKDGICDEIRVEEHWLSSISDVHSYIGLLNKSVRYSKYLRKVQSHLVNTFSGELDVKNAEEEI